MNWHLKTFDQLTNLELYQIIKLRVDIFVVEQDCPYSDLDNKDLAEGALHLFAEQDGQVVCYTRILPPGVSYPNMPSLGRVVTHASVRGSGVGHEMLERCVAELDQRWPNKVCHISAQAHLQHYYARQGFVAVGEGYLEDNIPHIGMERQPRP